MPLRIDLGLGLLMILCSLTQASWGEDRSTAKLLRQLREATSGRTHSVQARRIWDMLAQQGPAILPDILEAMETPNITSANWLRMLFDRIADDAIAKGGKGIDVDKPLVFLQDSKRTGRARRLALELVERLRPGTRARLVPGWLEDDEFRFEAIESSVRDANALLKAGQKDKALSAYQRAFAACRDVPQAQALADRLKGLGLMVSVAEHFGFLTDWYVVGPFDGRGMTGFQTVYPPERQIDLTAHYDGKQGRIHWKRFRLQEPAASQGARVALVNLLEPLGPVEDAVAYAYSAFQSPRARLVEFRGAGDDNLTVWVNGNKSFGFEEYRNGVRLDRHRFRVQLRTGVNTVLVKVCQAASDAANPDPNWEFFLRIVDASGKGLALKTDLPPASRR
jgi:hypothetical protein